MLCCTDSSGFSSNVDEKANEDVQHSLSDNSRRLVQTSDNRTQSVYLSDHVRVDTSNQLDTDDDCEPSYSACDTKLHVESEQHMFMCEVCSKKFAKRSTFNIHMRIHTGEKPFSCEFCDKKFKTPDAVRRHVRTHTGERPFSCNVCDKKFTQSSSLSEHMRIHTGEPVSYTHLTLPTKRIV